MPPYTKVRCWKSRSSEARLISSTELLYMAAFTATRTAYMPLSLTLNSQTLSPRSTYYCFIYIKEGRCKAYALHRPFSTVQPLKSYSYLSSLSIPVCRLHLGKADTLALIFHCKLVTFCKQKYIFYIIIF